MSYRKTAVDDYVKHLVSAVPTSLDGLRIAVDCANGSASATAAQLFCELGADVHFMSNSPDGVNINLDCGSTHMGNLRQYVLDNGMDVGVAFDGDADRCLCIDEKGNTVDGDFIMAICALDMKQRGKLRKDTVVGTIMTNMGFHKFCDDNDIRFEATKVGDRYVLEEMEIEGYNFGGEQSGHVIFRDFSTTGDGQLTAIQLLCHLRGSGKTLSELAGVMTRYPQVMKNVRVSPQGKLAFYNNEAVHDIVEAHKAKLGEEGRIVVRVSGTEPLIRVMVEGRDEAAIQQAANEVAQVVKTELT